MCNNKGTKKPIIRLHYVSGRTNTIGKIIKNSLLNTARNDTFSDDIKTNTKHMNDLAFLTDRLGKQTWIIDRAKTSHISNSKVLFTDIKDAENSNVFIANGNAHNSYGPADAIINRKTSEGIMTLKDVLFVPDIESNVLSVRKATQSGGKRIFEVDKCNLMYNEITFRERKINNNLYNVILDETTSIYYAKLA